MQLSPVKSRDGNCRMNVQPNPISWLLGFLRVNCRRDAANLRKILSTWFWELWKHVQFCCFAIQGLFKRRIQLRSSFLDLLVHCAVWSLSAWCFVPVVQLRQLLSSQLMSHRSHSLCLKLGVMTSFVLHATKISELRPSIREIPQPESMDTGYYSWKERWDQSRQNQGAMSVMMMVRQQQHIKSMTYDSGNIELCFEHLWSSLRCKNLRTSSGTWSVMKRQSLDLFPNGLRHRYSVGRSSLADKCCARWRQAAVVSMVKQYSRKLIKPLPHSPVMIAPAKCLLNVEYIYMYIM